MDKKRHVNSSPTKHGTDTEKVCTCFHLYNVLESEVYFCRKKVLKIYGKMQPQP